MLVVLVVVDASDKRMSHELDRELMQALTRYRHVPAVLILNKVLSHHIMSVAIGKNIFITLHRLM